MKHVLLVIVAIGLAACAVEPGPTAAPTRAPTSDVTIGVMDSMPCAEVMRYFDSIRLQRSDKGLSTDMEAGNVELWIDFAVLMSRLHGETVNFEVARDKAVDCQ